MPIIVSHRKWTREGVESVPHISFLFGDNDQREGTAGQACIRGLDNAIGVRTKRSPNMNDGAFYSDEEREWNIGKMEKDLEEAQAVLEAGDKLVIYKDLVGTGLAELPKRAPETYHWIQLRLRAWLVRYGFSEHH